MIGGFIFAEHKRPTAMRFKNIEAYELKTDKIERD